MGLVADESLDYETIDEKIFEIVIIVTDRGNPNSLSSNQTINLTVGDINDENPTLRLLNIEDNVLENQPAGFQLLQFEIQDRDTSANVSKQLNCNCLKSSQIVKENCQIFSIQDNTIILSRVFEENFQLNCDWLDHMTY